MKYNEKLGIDVILHKIGSMKPKLKIVIDGEIIYIPLSIEFVQDLNGIYADRSEEVLNNFIDFQIETHPRIKKIIRKKKLDKINNQVK